MRGLQVTQTAAGGGCELDAAALAEVASSATMDEARQRLGRLLGAPGPVSAQAMAALVEHENYARYLLAARRAPEMLAALLANPPATAGGAATSPETPGAGAVLGNAVRSLGAWARSGLARADTASYDRRRAACRVCPHFVDPPDTVLYRIATRLAEEKRICASCGCVALSKARLASAACPEPDPADPSQTRWQEPRQA